MTGVTVVEAIDRVRQLAEELDTRSLQLAEVERQLEPIDAEYEQFVGDFHVGLWTQLQDGDISKLPSEALTIRMAHKLMSPELLGKRQGLLSSRDRLRRREAAIKTSVDAWRSVLSALKVEAEAAR